MLNCCLDSGSNLNFFLATCSAYFDPKRRNLGGLSKAFSDTILGLIFLLLKRTCWALAVQMYSLELLLHVISPLPSSKLTFPCCYQYLLAKYFHKYCTIHFHHPLTLHLTFRNQVGSDWSLPQTPLKSNLVGRKVFVVITCSDEYKNQPPLLIQ